MNNLKNNLPVVAIVGRPNVGKSTFFNRLTGRRTALVMNQPGITRDRRYGECDWDGFYFRVIDTGGVELHPKNNLEKKMTEQSFAAIKDANLVLVVLDGRMGVTAEDRDWLVQTRNLGKEVFYVVNKMDSEKQETLSPEFYELGLSSFFFVSSETGRGVSQLLDEIKIRLSSDTDSPTEKIEEGLRVALLGRPNVGKSTLYNRLLGEERMVVDDTPGTTRDPIDSYLKYGDELVCLVDTAGIKKRGQVKEDIETITTIRSLQSLERANYVLLLIDGVEGITAQDTHVAGEAFRRKKALIVLINKWDEAKKVRKQSDFIQVFERKFHFVPYCPFLFISAKKGMNVQQIFPKLLELKSQYEKRISTSTLNKFLEKTLQSHALPVYKGKDLKIYYMTQGDTRPPTFIFFCDYPNKVHFSYERYLANRIREEFGMSEIPLKLVFKKRS